MTETQRNQLRIKWLLNKKTDFKHTNLTPRACTLIPSSLLSVFLEQTAIKDVKGELALEE